MKTIQQISVTFFKFVLKNNFFFFLRPLGLDLEHAKLALTELARFHALGMALKHHEAALFEEAKTCMREIPFDVTDMNQEAVICHLIKTICQDPRIAKYESRIWSIMPKNHADVLEVQAVEPWVTIVHGDFWVNNIMFRTGTNIEKKKKLKHQSFEIKWLFLHRNWKSGACEVYRLPSCQDMQSSEGSALLPVRQHKSGSLGETRGRAFGRVLRSIYPSSRSTRVRHLALHEKKFRR